MPAKKNAAIWAEKYLVPTAQFIKTLTAARLAADVMGVPTLIVVARTDANGANLLTSDIDPYDRRFPDRGKNRRKASSASTRESSKRSPAAWRMRRMRIWSGAKLPRLIWMKRTKFAEAIHKKLSGKLLAYNCSPSFNWRKNLTKRRSRNSSASSEPWATSFNS